MKTLQTPIEPLYGAVGRHIVRRRETAGLTQDQLGKLVKLSRETISGIEHATQRIQLHTLVAIDDVLKAFE